MTKPAVFLTLFKRWGGASLKEWVRMVKEDYKENIWSVREKGKVEERNMVGLSKKGRRRKTMEEETEENICGRKLELWEKKGNEEIF